MASVRRYRTAKGETRYSVRWRDADGHEHERAAGPLRAEAGVSCRFHDLRHTFAAYLVEGNVHPKAMQRLLGHSSIRVTLDTYGHLLPEALDDAMEAFDRAVAEPPVGTVRG